jgi:4-azaleucine resistance transporter AzlC
MATIDDIRTGLRRSAGLAGSTFVLGVTFGALARAHGWGLGAPVVASLAIFSGSAQFALLTVLAGGGAAWTAVASAALINLRFFPMALSAAPVLRGGRTRRAVEAQTVVDGSWVLAHQGEGRFNRGVLFGSALAQWPAWVTGTILGVVLAPSTRLLDATGLDVVFPAFFALLLFDEMRHTRSARIAAAGAAVITAVLLLALPAGPALLGGAAAALLGLRSTKTEQSC